MVPRKRPALASPLLVALLAADLLLALVFGALFLRRPAPLTAGARPAENWVTGRAVDAYSAAPLGGVTLTLGDGQATTDGQGAFRLRALEGPAMLVARPSEAHAGAEGELPPGGQPEVLVVLRPTVVTGTITMQSSGAPLAGAVVRAVGPGGEGTPEVATGADGRYILRGVPAGARLIVEGPGMARQELELGQRTALDLAMRQDVLTGTVRDKAGAPLAGVSVAAGAATATTGPDGAYTLSGVPEGATVVAKARGYQPQQFAPGASTTADVTLEPLAVRAIYLTPDTIADDRKFNALLALADRTEINAMVLDLKDETGWLHYESQIPTAKAIGAVHPSYDVAGRLQTLRDHGIYSIARVVCFQDHTLATKRPDLAVRNTSTGGPWKNVQGVAWTSAMKPETWDYLAAVAVEAAQLGFDEIQYDYVRFPTDGATELMDLGAPSTKETRTDAIANFLKHTRAALAPYGAALAVDVFGVTLFDKNDVDEIGQSLEKIAPHVDYICPMIYPSHYIPGIFGFDLPNDHPYEIILGSLQLADGRIPNPQVMLRPWLQDFSYGRGIDYGPREVRAQIQATNDYGASGWMLWNAANEFTEAGLEPE